MCHRLCDVISITYTHRTTLCDCVSISASGFHPSSLTTATWTTTTQTTRSSTLLVACDVTQFTCVGDGMCIDESNKCNGVNDCEDESDEMECTLISEYWCLGVQCCTGCVLCHSILAYVCTWINKHTSLHFSVFESNPIKINKSVIHLLSWWII